jgi:hypothetical protein
MYTHGALQALAGKKKRPDSSKYGRNGRPKKKRPDSSKYGRNGRPKKKRTKILQYRGRTIKLVFCFLADFVFAKKSTFDPGNGL